MAVELHGNFLSLCCSVVHLEAVSAESHAFGDADVEILSAQYKLMIRENDCACNKQQLYLFSSSNILDTI